MHEERRQEREQRGEWDEREDGVLEADGEVRERVRDARVDLARERERELSSVVATAAHPEGVRAEAVEAHRRRSRVELAAADSGRR